MIPRIFFFAVLAWGLFVTAPVSAEISQRDAQRYCVDIVLLKGGVELRGSVLKRDASHTTLAVQRDWLKSHQPEMARQSEDTEAQQTEQNRLKLKERIAAWRKEREDQPRLTFVLDQQLEKLGQPIDLMEPSQFLIVDIPADRVRRVFEAPAATRSVAAAAWYERLPKVEETVSSKLKTDVEKTHPKWAEERLDISDRLPRGQSQSDEEWAARQSLWEYEFCQTVNFQGTGNLIVRVEVDKRPDLASLLSQSPETLLAGQLGGLGLDLDLGGGQLAAPKSDWQKKAMDEAAKIGARGFLVTRAPEITGQGPAVVACQFFARLPDGKYRAIWSDEVRTDPATIKEADLKRIQEDPQIQEVLKVAQSLNLGNEIQKAVRFGGAVEASMNTVNGRFSEFRSRYIRSLDGPPLALPQAQN